MDSHYCCEGEGACREFVIMAIPLKKAILAAYNDLDLSAVRKIAGQKSKRKAEEAEKLLKVKEEHPAFDSIEYWWLDDLIANITLGYDHLEVRLGNDTAIRGTSRLAASPAQGHSVGWVSASIPGSPPGTHRRSTAKTGSQIRHDKPSDFASEGFFYSDFRHK